jgi:hypothetical protein
LRTNPGRRDNLVTRSRQLATFWSDRIWRLAGAGPAPIEKSTIAAKNQAPLLTELEGDSLGVGALNTLECALILEHPFG